MSLGNAAALRHPVWQWAMGAIVGGVLVYASYDKILDPQGFARVVYRYRLAGPTAATGFVPPNALAAILPWAELLTGLLLILNLWRREAALIAGGMMAMFIAAVGYAMAMGIDMDGCGCFTLDAGGRSAGWSLIAADAGLLLLALGAALPPARPAPAASPSPPGRQASPAAP